MKAKLTLTLEKEVIEEAKAYAKDYGQSLSKMVEDYFKVITEKEGNNADKELSPIVKSLKGSIKAPYDFDYKEEIRKLKAEKYL